jgi:hypothetical protein
LVDWLDRGPEVPKELLTPRPQRAERSFRNSKCGNWKKAHAKIAKSAKDGKGGILEGLRCKVEGVIASLEEGLEGMGLRGKVYEWHR